MGEIALFILKNWRYIIMAALLAFITYQYIEIDDKDVIIANQKTQITALSDANLAFKTAADKQNTHIQELEAEDAQRRAAAASALTRAAAAAKISDAAVKKLLASKPVGNDCQNSNRLITAYIKGIVP